MKKSVKKLIKFMLIFFGILIIAGLIYTGLTSDVLQSISQGIPTTSSAGGVGGSIQ